MSWNVSHPALFVQAIFALHANLALRSAMESVSLLPVVIQIVNSALKEQNEQQMDHAFYAQLIALHV